MATISEQLREGVPDFASVNVTGDLDGPKLYLPGTILKAVADRAKAREALGLGQRHGGAVFAKSKSIYKRPRNFPMGKFYDDTGALAAQGNPGGGLRKPIETLSFRALRSLADVWIDRLIIEARKAQMRRFSRVCDVPGKEFGFRAVHRRYQDPEFDSNSPDIRRRCQEANERLRKVTKPVHQSFADFLENCIEEELVIDRRCVVLPQSRGGKIASYHLTDGAYVLPRLEVLADYMVVNGIQDYDVAERRIQLELMRNPPRDNQGREKWVDFANAAYVQVINEQIVDAWAEDEMYIAIAHPSIQMNRWGYGRSNLETSWGMSLLFMQAMRYNKNLFDVNYPEAILSVSGNVDEEGLAAFKRNILDYDASEASTRLPIIDGGMDAQDMKVEIIKLRDTPKDMLFSEMVKFIANLKCAAYRMHPSTINVTPDGQGGAVVNVDQGQGDQIAQATEEGFHSLVMGQADMLTVVLELDEDLMYIVEGLDRETEQTRVARIQAMSETSTFDEVRAMWDQKALPKGVPVDPGDYVVGQAYLAVVNSITGAQQQQQQQDMGSYGQGDFGQPPGGQQGGDPNAPQQPPTPGSPPGLPGNPGAPGGPGAPGAGPPGGGPRMGTPPPGSAGRKPNPLFKAESMMPRTADDWARYVDGEGDED